MTQPSSLDAQPCAPAPGGKKPKKPKEPRKRNKQVRITAKQREEEAGDPPLGKHWRGDFLQALAQTSNVTAAAAAVGACTGRVYKARRLEPDFAAAWRAALFEGYQNLEMEVLGYLRAPDPARKLDIPGAIRLLTLHREEAARERSFADNRNEQEVLDSIDAMIDEMRGRTAANAALLVSEGEESDGSE